MVEREGRPPADHVNFVAGAGCRQSGVARIQRLGRLPASEDSGLVQGPSRQHQRHLHVGVGYHLLLSHNLENQLGESVEILRLPLELVILVDIKQLLIDSPVVLVQPLTVRYGHYRILLRRHKHHWRFCLLHSKLQIDVADIEPRRIFNTTLEEVEHGLQQEAGNAYLSISDFL